MKIQVVSDRRLNQGFGLLCSLPLSLLLGVGAAGLGGVDRVPK